MFQIPCVSLVRSFSIYLSFIYIYSSFCFFPLRASFYSPFHPPPADIHLHTVSFSLFYIRVSFIIKLIAYKRFLYTHSVENIYLSLVHTGSWGTFFMKSPVLKFKSEHCKYMYSAHFTENSEMSTVYPFPLLFPQYIKFKINYKMQYFFCLNFSFFVWVRHTRSHDAKFLIYNLFLFLFHYLQDRQLKSNMKYTHCLCTMWLMNNTVYE